MKDVTPPLPLQVAMQRMLAAVVPVARTERVALDEAAWRVLATPVTATADVPPFDRALMDGYAVRAADTSGATADAPARLAWRGATFTGETPAVAVEPGTCVGIATGAVMPDGADAVVMVEQTDRDGDDVLVRRRATARQHIGWRGGDLATGDTVCDAGLVLTPARLGALAASGATDVHVHARPLVAIASTGNEVVAPGTRLAPGQIHDINRFTLPPIIRANGGLPRLHDTLRDERDALHAFFAATADADVIVVSGGSSVGERDLLAEVVGARGDILFHGIAVKPGKPTMLGRVGTSLVLGLPGNPTSCLSNAYILLIPLLRAVARLPAWRPERRVLPLARTIANTSGRHMFFSVRVEEGAAVPAFKGSGEITSLSRADGYVEIPADVTQVEAGSPVTVTVF
jgi:molybdenum cofactor synthesis domain-containing protein